MKILLFVALISLAFASAPLRCGVVNELGEERGVDVDIQASTTKLAASWSGFEDGWEKNRILRYEWCIISSSLARSQEIQDRECRTTSGFLGLPDVYGWVNAERSSSGIANNLRLKNGETYYVVIRATTALGAQKYINSDGITIDTSLEAKKTRNNEERDVSDRKLQERYTTPPAFAQSPGTCATVECPINEEWRCPGSFEVSDSNSASRSAFDSTLNGDGFYYKRPSVRAYLEQFYGPPQFLIENSALAPFRVAPIVPVVGNGVVDDDGADDEDDLSDGDVIGIAIGITAFFCFITIGIILVASLFGSGDKFDTNVRRHDNVEEF